MHDRSCICNHDAAQPFLPLALYTLFVLLMGALLGLSVVRGDVEPSYESACRACQFYRVPLVVGVGCAAPDAKGWATCSVRSLAGYKAPCIVVAMPWKEQPAWVATLPATATVAEIRAAIPREWKVPEPKAYQYDGKLPKKWNPYTVPQKRAAVSVRATNC